MEIRNVLCHLQIRILLFVMGLLAAIVVLIQLLELPYQGNKLFLAQNSDTVIMTVEKNTTLNISTLFDIMDDMEMRSLDGKSSSIIEDNLRFKNFTSIYNGSDRFRVMIVSTSKKVEQPVRVTVSNISTVVGNFIAKRRGKKVMTMSEMNSVFHQASSFDNSMRAKGSTARDRELQHARLQIENAPIVKDTRGLYASVFRNVSTFIRSYELMEHILKVYIYNEGEKPIFHEPMLKGVYASEGWFMKLMEGNKKFVTKDPKKAHLFYLPFSSRNLRSAFLGSNRNDLIKYLDDYVDIIARKYKYWNRRNGSDHFLVACHDWAPKLTRNIRGNPIKILCNTNLAQGFKIEKDISLPVTYIRSSANPVRDLGGNYLPSEKPILAFFAGSMHGNLRPILLKHWENKLPDMKIFGPMPRDIEGKNKYREFMKSSKYCICAKGYEVHTPRVVESIYYECVPVIISDNYVPPLFGILNWESFAVFVLEEDVPNLRDILVSIPEEKYLAMQVRVKMVQRHFIWHKEPIKYDLFHMVLHSIWHRRLLSS